MLVLDVGSYDGQDGLAWHAKGYDVIAFEPKRDLYEALVERTKHLAQATPFFRVVNKAVSCTDGEVEFHLCVSGGASSILPFKPDAVLDAHWSPDRTDIHSAGVSYTVQSTRLDTFLESEGLADRPLYVHIDAQGVDLDVLKSLGRYISNVRAGVLETCYSLEKAIYSAQTDTVLTVQAWLAGVGCMVERVSPNDVTGCECNVYFSRIST